MTATGEPLLEMTDLVKHFPVKRGLLNREVDTSMPGRPRVRAEVEAAQHLRWRDRPLPPGGCAGELSPASGGSRVHEHGADQHRDDRC